MQFRSVRYRPAHLVRIHIGSQYGDACFRGFINQHRCYPSVAHIVIRDVYGHQSRKPKTKQILCNTHWFDWGFPELDSLRQQNGGLNIQYLCN